MQNMRRTLLIVLAIVLISGTLTGCAGYPYTDSVTGDNQPYRERVSVFQFPGLFIGELILLVIVVLIVALLIAVFFRYRKTARLAMEAEIRERTLLADNKNLDRVNRMKTEFFQNMSHDFKTPLTVISTSVLNAMDMLDFEMDKEEMRESLKLAQSEIMRMARIVDSAMKHSSLHDNRQSLEPLDMIPILRNVARTYRAFLERYGNTLTVRAQRSLPLVYGNADMLLNVLSNLISNSNRHTRNGEVTLSVFIADSEQTGESPEAGHRSARQFISVSVEDNGEGINPEIFPHIFTRGASDGGSGLGLSIIKTAIETHGGTITIESKYSVGTKVTFTLPAYDESKHNQEN